MGELEPKTKLTELSVEQRASLGQDLFIAKAKGKSMRSLAKVHNVTEHAVRVLIAEYGAYLQETNTHTKEANIAAYDFVLENAAHIIENPGQYSVLLQAKGYEAFIQALTRKDKLLGHEAPTHNINTKGETMLDIVKQRYDYTGTHDGVSPMDTAVIGEEEEIEDAEVIDAEE